MEQKVHPGKVCPEVELLSLWLRVEIFRWRSRFCWKSACVNDALQIFAGKHSLWKWIICTPSHGSEMIPQAYQSNHSSAAELRFWILQTTNMIQTQGRNELEEIAVQSKFQLPEKLLLWIMRHPWGWQNDKALTALCWLGRKYPTSISPLHLEHLAFLSCFCHLPAELFQQRVLVF